MTCRLSLAELALVQTFRYRQSSLRAGSRGGAASAGAGPRPAPRAPPPRPPNGAPAAQGAPKAFALRTPSHLAAGCGARHRFSPRGGAAYGIPLNARTVGCVEPTTPASTPVSMRTWSGIMAEGRATTNRTPLSRRKIPNRFINASVAEWLDIAAGKDTTAAIR